MFQEHEVAFATTTRSIGRDHRESLACGPLIGTPCVWGAMLGSATEGRTRYRAESFGPATENMPPPFRSEGTDHGSTRREPSRHRRGSRRLLALGPTTSAPVSDMADVVILGGGGHAAVLLGVLQRLGHRVIGFTAPNLNGARISVPYHAWTRRCPRPWIPSTSSWQSVSARSGRTLAVCGCCADSRTNVAIGHGCMVGAGSIVSHGGTICARALIGTGATVVACSTACPLPRPHHR